MSNEVRRIRPTATIRRASLGEFFQSERPRRIRPRLFSSILDTCMKIELVTVLIYASNRREFNPENCSILRFRVDGGVRLLHTGHFGKALFDAPYSTRVYYWHLAAMGAEM